jgi:hypothetical protein
MQKWMNWIYDKNSQEKREGISQINNQVNRFM